MSILRMGVLLALCFLVLLSLGGCSDDVEVNRSPYAKIIFPPNYSISESNEIVVRGIAADETAVAGISVNGVQATSSDGFATWQATVPLQEGLNSLSVVAQDDQGRSGLSDFSYVRRQYQLSIAQDLAFDSVSSRFLAMDRGRQAIVTVDPVSGQSALFPSAERLLDVTAIAVDEPNNRLLFLEHNSVDTLKALNLSDGSIAAISTSNGSTPAIENPFSMPSDIVTNAAGSVGYVLNEDDGFLLRVDLADGSRQRIANVGGLSTDGFFRRGLALDEANDRALLVDIPNDEIIAVDLTSGLLSTLSTAASDGIELLQAQDALYDSIDDTLLVIEREGRLVRIDLSGGTRSLVVDLAFTTVHPRPPTIAALAPSDEQGFVVASDGNRLLRIDTTSGAATVLNTSATQSLPRLYSPQALTLDSRTGLGYLVGNQAAYLQNYDTGRRTGLIEGDALLSGARIYMANDLGNRQVLAAVDGSSGIQIVAIDLLSRSSSVLSSNTVPDALNPVTSVRGLVLDEPRGRVAMIDPDLPAVLAVNLMTGQRSIVSDATNPDGLNALAFPAALAACEEGVAYVLDSDQDRIVEVDLSSGGRTIISDVSQSASDTAFDPSSSSPGLTCDVENRILYATRSTPTGDEAGYVAIDIATGQRSFIPAWQSGELLLPYAESIHYDSYCNCLHVLNDTFGLATIDLITLNWTVISR